MIADATYKTANRRGLWKKLFCSLGAATGLLTGEPGAGATPADAQSADYRSATTAPAVWQAFAKQLQSQFQQRLAADDATARLFRSQMEKRTGDTKDDPLALIVRAWISAEGKLERIECDALDPDAAVTLRALLAGGDVGAPPPDMLQPLHLRLSLGSDPQPGRRE